MLGAFTADPPVAGRFLVDESHAATAGVSLPAARSYVEAGHPIVWNAAHGASATLDGLCSTLSETLGAKVWPNLYATSPDAAPFDMHFDNHDVLVVHLEGSKHWYVSTVRADTPLHLAHLAAATARLVTELAPAAAADLAFEVTLEPGDVLYLPRGQFHEAVAVDGPALHVSIGIALPTGVEVLRELADRALRHSSFRTSLPAIALDPTGELRRDHLRRLVAELAAIAESDPDAILAALRGHILSS